MRPSSLGTSRRRHAGPFEIGWTVALAWGAAACSSDPATGPTPSPPAAPGVPVSMVAASTGTQAASAGSPVPSAPSVIVLDAAGTGVSGVVVSFRADPGNGTTAGRDVETGSDGRATVGSWTLGPDPGAQRVHARVSGLPTVTFIAIATVPPAIFDIEIRFNVAGGTPAQRQAFRVAEARWQAVIRGEMPDVHVTESRGFCGSNSAFDETIDDLLILAEIVAIDGVGGVLGSAGPCLLRTPGGIPVMGRMRFDAADLDNLEAGGTLDDVIVHEMGHVLGIGPLWSFFGLVADSAGADSTAVSDPHFTGAAATAAFAAIGGGGYTGDVVPVEDSGGSGTRLVHWRETVFENELMTGFVDAGSNPLSVVSISSLEDLGYTVDLAAAESYALALSAAPRRGPKIALGDDLLRAPVYTIDRHGRIRPIVIR